MPRDRAHRRGSPDSSLYEYGTGSRSPSPTYPRSRSRTRHERRDSEYESHTRSRSRSHHRGRRNSSVSSSVSVRSVTSRRRSSSRKAGLKEKIKDKTTTTSGLKTSLVFLGSIAAATYAAHKFWPKGITYGDREAWEEAEHEAVKKVKKVKKMVKGETSPRRGGGGYRAPQYGPESGRLIEDDRRYIAYDRPRSTLARYESEDVVVRRGGGSGDRLAVEDAQFVRRTASMSRGHSDGVTTMSVASGSRAGDARRAQYVADGQTRRGDGVDYARAAPRFVERELPPRRRSSFDEPPDVRRGERVVYTRQEAEYR